MYLRVEEQFNTRPPIFQVSESVHIHMEGHVQWETGPSQGLYIYNATLTLEWEKKIPFPKQGFNSQPATIEDSAHFRLHSHSDQSPNITVRISKRMTWVQDAACTGEDKKCKALVRKLKKRRCLQRPRHIWIGVEV